MKKGPLLLAFLLLTSMALYAQKTESVLWKISGNGIKKPSYLFGTIHVASIALLDSFPQLMRIAQNADFAIFENGGSHIGNIPTPVESNQPPLDSLFTSQEYAKVDSFFTASPHGSIRPHNDEADLFSMVQVAMTIIENKTQHDRFDDLLFAKMRDLNKPVFQLDVPDDVEKVITSLGYQRLAKFLVYIIDKNAPLKNVLPKNEIDFELYSKTLQNPLKLDEKVNENAENATVKRNAKWLPKIEQKVKEGSCFIAVGLGHLQYQSGLIQLLRNKGYAVNPVKL
ncbi:TraB/GumN family protein [Dyadobacter sp. CY261]|uniref:TraB/GumN family protein n=1 Tax=Dyadobacter sp. CY261 TaxID=2907203 RepID=UPI001F1C62D1|nr:TraB/GumN family protein [Dyadobacter sp. CY261]MCF0070159.1 TraB/GumN family protein [Dyadobacter sp. CY261]